MQIPWPIETFNVKTRFNFAGEGPGVDSECVTPYHGVLKAQGVCVCSYGGILVYFSLFNPIQLTPDSVMQQAGLNSAAGVPK
jgi:hypothetical protein